MERMFKKLKKIWQILLDKDIDEEEGNAFVIGNANMHMCKACELAKVIINECFDRDYSISAAKLQKLLVLMHGEHLAKYDKNLFPENVLCWKCGVAIKEVELRFLLHDFSRKEKLPEHIAVLKTEEFVMHKILDEFGSLDLLEINRDRRLVQLTTSFPYQEGEKIIIPNEEIERVFLTYGNKI